MTYKFKFFQILHYFAFVGGLHSTKALARFRIGPTF